LAKSTNVIPAKAGIQFLPSTALGLKLDSRLRGNDVVSFGDLFGRPVILPKRETL
jgi:hypothetical protein